MANGLAVLEPEELALARDAGWSKPLMLIEGVFSSSELMEVLPLASDLVIHSLDQLGWLLERLDHLDPSRHRLWIKLNTGMNRLGFGAESDGHLLSALPRLRAVLPEDHLGFMMHFASGEQWQLAEAPRTEFFNRLRQLGHRALEPVSLSNSAASLVLSHGQSEWLRPGIALYGATPFGDREPQASDFEAGTNRWASLGLRPAASLTSRVIGVQALAQGQAVGYGGQFVAARPSRVALVALGYADGYPRCAPSGTPVWLSGQTVPLAGRVSMDLIAIDVTDHPAASMGDLVEFWGSRLPVDLVAHACGTNGYELLTGVTARVHRRYAPLD